MKLPSEFSIQNYEDTYALLYKCGYKYPCKSAKMSIFGGTIFPSSNKFTINGIVSPRPNSASKLGSSGYDVMKSTFFMKLVAIAEYCMLYYLKVYDPKTLQKVLWFKQHVPPELRVSGTIFNGCALVGNLMDGYNHIHVDKNDMCSLIVMLGNNVIGGDTLYYSGESPSNPGRCVHSEPFYHGKFQVGPFQKVVHAGSHWKGPRGIISFYINKQLYQHFRTYGIEIYKGWSQNE